MARHLAAKRYPTTSQACENSDVAEDAIDDTSAGDVVAEVDQCHTAPDPTGADAGDDGETSPSLSEQVAQTESGSGAKRRKIARIMAGRTPAGQAVVAGVAFVAMLSAAAGFAAYQVGQNRRAAHERAVLIRVAEEGAINLTTIDAEHIDADVRRILDSATGAFHDEFQERSKGFVDFVKEIQSKTEGNVTASGYEGQDGDDTRVLAALSVRTSAGGKPDDKPRFWRMRITVHNDRGQGPKVSNVEFVP